MIAIDPLLYILFITATAGFIFTPGPIVSLIVSETIHAGIKNGIAVAAGAQVISLIYLIINLFGFASIAALPTIALDIIRYSGAAYLLYLAWSAFSRSPSLANGGFNAEHTAPTPSSSFKKALLIASTSPKTILFFAAFFPQFVSDKLPITNQLIILSVTFLIISFTMDIGWSFTANKARQILMQKDKLALANKISGCVLAAGAILLLLINS